MSTQGSPPRVRGTAQTDFDQTAGERITPARAGNRSRLALYPKGCRDHPRACGEQEETTLAYGRREGSPPRVRGTAPPPGTTRTAKGITPARAGNRDQARHNLILAEDHPRACGEQRSHHVQAIHGLGSPPRVRGTGYTITQARRKPRITPARAGNRSWRMAEKTLQKDHPRACGEQKRPAAAGRRLLGSPPRVRGTARPLAVAAAPIGITPARAGNRAQAAPLFCRQRDHPRACGEQETTAVYEDWQSGSPPRVRGTEHWTGFRLVCARITPARAGNSSPGSSHGPAGRDHPRACGEQTGKASSGWFVAGSPPRVRGTASHGPAGSTAPRDHPRACGEQTGRLLLDRPVAGSPPRVRGTDHTRGLFSMSTGIPPARAGNREKPGQSSPRSRGSPPRVRGTEKSVGGNNMASRITPARAGNSSPPAFMGAAGGDHPRACGEQLRHTPSNLPATGSPPRVRGTDNFPGAGSVHGGITPARAGNRPPFRSNLLCTKDHPRACGEQAKSPATGMACAGSPPRVRGTGGHLYIWHGGRGITPARAGNRHTNGDMEAALGDHPRACGEQPHPP